MPHYERTELGVKGVIFRRGRLLLLRRRDYLVVAPGLWDLPGGGVEVGDSLEDSLVREVREETGFAVRVGPPIHAAIVRTHMVSGKALVVTVVYYRCSMRATGPPRLDAEEHTQYAWVTRRELPTHQVVPDQVEPIRLAFATSSIPSRR